MQPSDFNKDTLGHLIQTQQGYWAFTPPPLEPALDLNLRIVNKLTEAERALGELAGVARTLPNPHLLIGPFLRREAVLSSRIEGTRASLSDLFFFEAANLREKEVPDVREVANYVGALEYGLRRLNEIPVSLRLIREIHGKLMTGVRGEHMTPGEFRMTQNWIGPPGCTLMDATYVPPPVPDMLEALDSLEKYLHAQSKFPPLIKLALVHYQFEAIHPFLDGNGRIGRLLTTLILCAQKLLPQPLLYLSAYFEQHREEYYEYLLGISLGGDWENWIMFFLDAINSQSIDAIDRSDQLLAVWQKYKEQLQKARASVLLLRLVDELFAYPVITNRFASGKLEITPRAAQMNIDKLISFGIIKETTGKQRNRVYIAPKIIEIIERY
jgi:Fic family protein